MLVRICPTCDAENAPEVMRCVCGALLAGLDLVNKQEKLPTEQPMQPAAVPSEKTDAIQSVVCPHEDCAQPNPPGSETCLYCNRPLAADHALAPPGRSLLNLPGALKSRFRILHPLPTQGAEAELLMVEPVDGGPSQVAKIYRHGIRPKREVQERIARVGAHNRVVVHEAGISDGYAYELMEFCAYGSLRDRMKSGPLSTDMLAQTIRELAAALADVHEAGLVHRDLKPENILLRSQQPLDLVLTDFGIASVLDATQRFTGTARTLPYAAPESLSGVIDAKADYWAFGVIVLEAALGRHPFAGLSEAVILHHLATRSIDLSGVRDAKLVKLLRGLLQRDPKLRWGADEVTRWLDGDASLPEPAGQDPGNGFAEPYRLGQDICHTHEQLAVALARHWKEGIADLLNGQLLAWFRDVQKDHNVVRVLFALREESTLSVDVQLLRLILHLAPGIPPVWRGESIELPAILARANAALKGDEEAEQWLGSLHSYRVLETYAQAGNSQAASVVEHWSRALERFEQAWKERLAFIRSKEPTRGRGNYVNVDRLLYSGEEPDRPPVGAAHARLLAIAYDASWAERLRQRLLAELTGLAAHCPWIGDLGDPQTMDAASLLVLDSLMPEARKTAERHTEAEKTRRESEAEECRALREELSSTVAMLRYYANERTATRAVCREIGDTLDRYFDLVARIQASGRADPAWQDLVRYAARSKRTAQQMRLTIDELAERRMINSGWMSENTLVFALLMLFIPPLFLGRSVFYVVVAAGCGILAWRLLPNFSLMKRIRELGEKL